MLGPLTYGALRSGGAGAVPFTPTDINGLALWLKADTGTLATPGGSTSINGGDVGEWQDQSGNDNHVTQSTPASAPHLHNDTLNGLPVVRFDGSDDALLSAAGALGWTGDQPMTVFAVTTQSADAPSTSGDEPLWSIGAELVPNQNDRRVVAYAFEDSSRNAVRLYGGNAVFPNTTLSTHIITTRYPGSGVVFESFVNGAQQTAASSSAGALAIVTATVAVGRSPVNTIALYYTGDIAELLVYDSALSETDRQNVEQYLADRYDLNLA